MAWFSGKVSLGNFPDLAGAVNKLSESVKHIKKNFDSALGFEEKSDSSSSEASALWPVMSFMDQKSEDSAVESPEKTESPQKISTVEENREQNSAAGQNEVDDENEILKRGKDHKNSDADEEKDALSSDTAKIEPEPEPQHVPVEPPGSIAEDDKTPGSVDDLEQKELSEVRPAENSESVEFKSGAAEVEHVDDSTVIHDESHDVVGSTDEQKTQAGETLEEASSVQTEVPTDAQAEAFSDTRAEKSSDAQSDASSDTQAEASSDSQAEKSSDAQAEAYYTSRAEASMMPGLKLLFIQLRHRSAA